MSVAVDLAMADLCAATDDSYCSSVAVGKTGAEAGVNETRSTEFQSTRICGNTAANSSVAVVPLKTCSAARAEVHHWRE